MINNSAISNLIRENKIHQIYSQIQLNQQKTGMTTQTQSMVKNVKSNTISKEDAIRFSTQPQELMNLIGV
jgi:twitching motility protein PilT